MSKFDEQLASAEKQLNDLGISFDADLLKSVAKGLGPALYNADASLVSCGDESELATVKKNFLIKKLGMADSADLDAAIKAICEKMGSSTRKKRVNFYYLLVEHFDKASVYN